MKSWPILLVLVSASLAHAEPLSGAILNGATLDPVANATVRVGDTQTKTNRAGLYNLDVSTGAVTVSVSAKGYDSMQESVIVGADGTTDVIILIFRTGEAGETVEITGNAPVPPPAIGKQDLPRDVLVRIPGSRGDALQSLRSLPGVGNQQGGGRLIVRGAAPEDSVYQIDGIEIPIVYHFFGLQSILPSEFVTNIEFLPSGFGVEDGRATGGLVRVVSRDDVAAKPTGFAEFSFINVAAFVRAPIWKAKGLQITAGVRRGLLDLVVPLVIPDDSSVSFTTAPTYYDAQLRVDFRPTSTDRFSAMGLLSSDKLSLLTGSVDPNDPVLSGATFSNKTSFARAIVSWQHASRALQNRLALAVGPNGFSFDIADRFLRVDTFSWTLRDDLSVPISSKLTVRAGTEAIMQQRTVALRFPQQPPEGEPPPTIFSSLPLIELETTDSYPLFATYAAADLKLYRRLSMTLGLRWDRYSQLRQNTYSPRLSLAYELPSRWTLRAAAGDYTQPLDQGESLADYLLPERAKQFIVGAEKEVLPGVKASGSLYYTHRQDLVTRDPLLAKTDPERSYTNDGQGRSFGFEGVLRAQRDNFFGWIAYTIARSDRVDRAGAPRRLFDFDETHNLIAVGSYKWRRWEFGGRFQLSTGNPDTPIVGSTYVADINAYVPVYGDLNSRRISAAHALDVRIDRRWDFARWKLSAFLDVTNVYAHARVLGYQYNFDYSERGEITDLPIVPAIGIRAEF